MRAGPGPGWLPAGWPAAAVLTVGAAVVYSWVAIYRHDRFASNAFDLGIQDQTVWGYSRLQILPNTVLGVPDLLGDHFNPILMVLAPAYRIWDSPTVLLVAQAILVSVAAVPVFLWGAQRLGPLPALAFQVSYLVFWGVLAGIIYDFHHEVFAVPAVGFALYAAINRRDRLLWAMVAMCFLVRENIAVTVMGLGVYVAVAQGRIKLGGILAAVSGAWFILLIQLVIPALGGAPYRHWLYDGLGTTPLRAAWHVVRHPMDSLSLLFEPFQKTWVWLGLLANWLFLPVASPIFVVALPALLERFWAAPQTLWSFHFQYSMLEAPPLAFAAIDTTARIVRRLSRVPWRAAHLRFLDLSLAAAPLAAGSLAVSLVLTLVLVQPWSEMGTYVTAAEAADIQSCLDMIPPTASVSASNFLLPHLANRRAIYLVTHSTDTDYIAIDISTYHRFAPGEEQALRSAIEDSLAKGYGVVCSKGLTVVLQRGAPDPDLSPQLAHWLDPTECGSGACAMAGLPGSLDDRDDPAA